MKIPHLETARLNLDLITQNDAQAVFDLQNQPQMVEQGAITRGTLEDMRVSIAKWDGQEYGMYVWRSKTDGHIVGTGGFETLSCEDWKDMPKYYDGKVEVAFTRVNKADEGQGYAKEAREVLFDYIFLKNHNLEQIFSFTRNPKIGYMNEKMGFDHFEQLHISRFPDGIDLEVGECELDVWRLSRENWGLRRVQKLEEDKRVALEQTVEDLRAIDQRGEHKTCVLL